MKTNKVYFDNLDSIRFIAATMVFLGHAYGNSYENLPDNTLKNILNLISSGATGVSIFFVLSGFLITYLLISEFNLNSKININTNIDLAGNGSAGRIPAGTSVAHDCEGETA